MIELKLWQALDAFAREGTISKAAKTLYISQPALSQALQRLEEELGVPLFARSGHNRVQLNESGQVAARQAAELLRAEEKARRTIRQADRQREYFLIGACAPVPAWDLSEVSGTLTGRTARVTVMEDDKALLEGLRNETFEIIAVTAPVKEAGLVSVTYLSETLKLAIPPSHPLAKRRHIRYADLAGQNLLLYEDIGFWNRMVRSRLRDVRFLRVRDHQAFEEAYMAGAFPFFTTDLLEAGMPPGFRAIPIDEPDATVHYCLVMPASRLPLLKELARAAAQARHGMQPQPDGSARLEAPHVIMEKEPAS